MSDQTNIRLNKALRKLNISTAQALQILENHGYNVNLIPSSKVTFEQYNTLLDNPHDFLQKKQAEKTPITIISKPKLSTSSRVRKRKSQIKKIQKQSIKREHRILKRKPEKSELMSKIRRLCLGKPLEKIGVMLNVSNPAILKMVKSVLPNYTLQHRISKDDFEVLKPKLEILVQEFIEDIPSKKMGEINGKKYKPSTYTKTSKYYGFVKIIYTNM